MSRRGLPCLICSALLVLLLVAGCGSAIKSTKIIIRQVGTGTTNNDESFVQFALSGGYSSSYALQAAPPTSKLRHGHREFTIDIVDSNISIFIVFYGYRGPGNYILSQYSNGGDVHIGLGKVGLSWDLTMQSRAECTMRVYSDTPMGSTGLDRMKGSFSCPFLYSSAPDHPQKPVTVKSGTFDIAIIVES
jgi:hypothetical protein